MAPPLHGTVASGPFHHSRWRSEGWLTMREFKSTRLRISAFCLHVSGLRPARCREAIEQRPQLLARELRVPKSIPSDQPVVRHVDKVAFLRNLANLEANHPSPQSPHGGVPDFHVGRVCASPGEPTGIGRSGCEANGAIAGRRDGMHPFS